MGKPVQMTLNCGVLVFEDGTEVSNVSVEILKAAPDLLEACRAVADTIRHLGPLWINPPFQAEAVHESAYERLMNVISQATGEEYEE